MQTKVEMAIISSMVVSSSQWSVVSCSVVSWLVAVVSNKRLVVGREVLQGGQQLTTGH